LLIQIIGCSTKIEDVELTAWIEDENTQSLLQDKAAALEYATSPAFKKICFQIQEAPIWTVENKNGVTVLDVVKELCAFFDSPMEGFDYGAIAYDREAYGALDPADMSFTYRDGMGDHVCWTGWDEVEVNEVGYLLLRALWFDS
jgi:hypothetical protein